MMKLFNYNVLEKYPINNNTAYLVQEDSTGKTLLVTELISSELSSSDKVRLKQECEALKESGIEGIIKPIDFLEYEKIYIVEETFDGIPLSKIIQETSNTLKLFIEISINLSQSLGELHKKNIVHRNINPDNIKIQRSTNQSKLFNFGIIYEVSHKNKSLYSPEVIKGRLCYISPEQTGRMNRSVDYRTDLYSLGVTMYEMFTGIPPFTADDPLKIIHYHIAKEPIPPIQINPNIPITISKIIMKLLSKNAEDRYQNSFGLMSDLKRCLNMLEKEDKIEDFEIAQKDISMKFNIPQNIYGRENEIKTLLSIFETVCDAEERSVEVILVGGHPGIGKSLLINEIHKPIVARRGYFIAGKYDQFRRDVPYSSIIQAFQSLVRQILSESEERILQWKTLLLDALGPNGKVITDVIPDVSLIIGKQPDVSDLPPEQAQNRFNFVFKNFTRVFATKEHPLVLFLDDIHWADFASFSLLKTLLTDSDIKYLLFIGAYRDNEVSFSHPLMLLSDNIKAMGTNINTMIIEPLKHEGVTDLISNFLRCKPEETTTISEIVFNKTAGNPFFVNQFLKKLYDEHLIQLDQTKGWTWDEKSIISLEVTDNVVEMMAQKITRLSEQTQEILKICACIGNRFDLETLSNVANKSIDEALSEILIASEEGLISPFGDSYKFYHDRIQEAAYSLILPEQKPEIHKKIGTFTLENTNSSQLRNKILYIVDQLNAGKSLLTTKEEKYKLAEYNLLAGIKAKSSAAYNSSYNYLKVSIELLDEDSWSSHYTLSHSIYAEIAESAYLNSLYDETANYSTIGISNCKNAEDKIRFFEINMQTYMAQNQPLEAIKSGLQIPKLFGLSLPLKPKMFQILIEMVKTKIALISKSPEDFLKFKPLENPAQLAKVKSMSALAAAAYWSAPTLLPMIILKSLRIMVKYGNTHLTPSFLAGYGLLLNRLDKIDASYKYGKIAIELLGKMNTKADIAKTIVISTMFTRHWKEHNTNTLPAFLQAYEAALETGDTNFIGYALQCWSFHSFFSGSELSNLEKDMQKYSDITKKIKQKTQLIMIQIYHQTVLNLIGDSKDPKILSGRVYDESVMLPLHYESQDKPSLVSALFQKVMLSYLFYDFEEAIKSSDKALLDMHAIAGTIKIPVFHYFYSLSLLASYKQSSSAHTKKSILKKVTNNQKKMKVWATHAPMNHLHKYYLVEAELARIKSNDSLAIELYQKAIDSARENKYINEEAISLEAVARYFLSKGDLIAAGAYINEAYKAYKKWGAFAKLKDIENRYAELIIPYAFDYNKDVSKTPTVNEDSFGTLDILTVLKLSQKLSEEIDLSRLLEAILTICIENAGAEKGLLLSYYEETQALYIKAEGSIKQGISVVNSLSTNSSADFCTSIVSFVRKTQKILVLSNAYEEGSFINDPYILENQVKSVLCLPIINRGKFAGILYLENNLASNAFTKERSELLSMLSSQAAISLENARLYKMATTDRMTGLVNNTHFRNILHLLMEKPVKENSFFCLLMLDIDFFKKTNDIYGHLAGDAVLKNVASIIDSTCGTSDISARYGGEEFSVILPYKNVSEAFDLAEKIRKTIEDSVVEFNNNKIKVTVSIGISYISTHKALNAPRDLLIESADKALYESKNSGRNKITVSEPL